MSKTKPGTVKETGAKSGDILFGIEKSNNGLKIRIHKNQAPGNGGRIEGDFDLLEAGDGVYASYLHEFVGDAFLSASELIENVARKSGAQKCTHILNRNMMRVSKSL